MTRIATALALTLTLALGSSIAEAQIARTVRVHRPLATAPLARPLQPTAARATVSIAPTPARPGQLRAIVDDNGAYAPATIEVRRSGRVVARGSSSAPLELPAGTYDVELTLETALDRPSQTVRVHVPEGGVATARASFRTAILEVRFTSDRAPVHGLAVVRQGDRVIGTLGSGVPARVSAGTYQIDARYRTDQRTYTVSLAPEQRRAIRAEF